MPKISELPAGTAVDPADLLCYVDETGTPTTMKITVQEFVNSLPAPTPLQVLTSFTGGSNNEIGSTVTSVNLNWSYNIGPDPTSQSINQGIGSVAVNLRTFLDSPVSITSNTTFTINAVGYDSNPSSLSTFVRFFPLTYVGVSNNILDNSTSSATFLADLIQDQEFSSGFAGTYTFDATISPGNNYLYIFYPASFGDPSAATFGGFPYSDYTIVTKTSFTNAAGFTQDYKVFRSNNQYNSAGLVIVLS